MSRKTTLFPETMKLPGRLHHPAETAGRTWVSSNSLMASDDGLVRLVKKLAAIRHYEWLLAHQHGRIRKVAVPGYYQGLRA